MSNNLGLAKKQAAVVCSLLLLGSPVSPLRAEDLQAETLQAEEFRPSYSVENRGSMIREATKAVVGRVFGVKGEAGNIEYHVFELTTRSPRNAGLRSFLIPGWGQHFNRQHVKGTLFFLSAAAATGGAIQLYNKSQDSYDEYSARGQKNSSLFEDYDDQRSQAMLLGGLAGVLWLWAVVDAYRNAYTPLYTRDVSIDLALRTDESAVRINKKF